MTNTITMSLTDYNELVSFKENTLHEIIHLPYGNRIYRVQKGIDINEELKKANEELRNEVNRLKSRSLFQIVKEKIFKP